MTFRSEKLRRYVASMTCVHCGSVDVQAALCWREHARLDQGKDLSRDERRRLLDGYIVQTFKRAELRRDCPAELLDPWRRELEKAGLLEVVL